MAIWSFEQKDSDTFVVWYEARGAVPVKCGEGPCALAYSWVIETASEPFDVIRIPGELDLVRFRAPGALAGRTLLS